MERLKSKISLGICANCELDACRSDVLDAANCCTAATLDIIYDLVAYVCDLSTARGTNPFA
jgi:hypothetical protein